ncbi:hypothetical protein AB0M05_43745 [Streptomyces violaceusniger]|uniref:hypothetical protein n=1 Tax=Streptomyces violaceusniger TaxID=68280 RepID=UPI003412F4AF
MSAAERIDADPDDRLIGHCYTKARRLPVVVGKIPGGNARLPGGPYTKTQLTVLVVLFVPLIATRSLWGTRSVLDLLIVIVIPYAGAWVLRFVRLDGRNPAAVMVSIAMLATAPRHGRLRGRPWRAAPARRARAACTLPPTAGPAQDEGDGSAPAADDAESWRAPAAAAPASVAGRERPETAGETERPHLEQPVTPRPTTSARAEEPVAAGDSGMRSGVQQLLAQRRTGPEHESTKGH